MVAAHLMALAFLRCLLCVAQQQLLTQHFPTWESSIRCHCPSFTIHKRCARQRWSELVASQSGSAPGSYCREPGVYPMVVAPGGGQVVAVSYTTS